ncbi:carboxylesterase family protein [Microbacterium sp. NPDC097977]|uniref:carboxylesterase family protein n=1 Tax=Microbacterium sp. NPDC097977 TaxID=3155686 RepID=UPI003325DEEF
MKRGSFARDSRTSRLNDAHPCPIDTIGNREVHLHHTGVRQPVREVASRRIVAAESPFGEHPSSPTLLEAGDDALYEAEDYALRDQMTSSRLNFVKTGDPNGGMLHSWPPFADAPDQVMEFDRGSRIAPRPQPEQVDFWMRYTGPVA